MASGTTAPAVDDWKDVPPAAADDWKDVGTPIQDKSTISAPAKTDWKGSAPVADWLSKKLAPIENYTDAERKEHPILAQIGDAARNSPITLPRQTGKEVYASPIPAIGAIGSLAEEAPAAAAPAMVVPESAPVAPKPTVNPVRRVPGEVPRDVVS